MGNEKIEKMLYDAQEKLPTTNVEWRVSDMVENSEKKKVRVNKAVAVAGLVLLISFATGNVVTLAVNGNSLMETAKNAYETWSTRGVERENVVINGNVAEIIESIRAGKIPEQVVEGSAVQIVEMFIEEDTVWYEFDYNGGESGMGYLIPPNPEHTSKIVYVIEDGIGCYIYKCELVEENGRIYLDGPNGMIDITLDFWDGKASGEVIRKSGDLAGKKLSYTVEGSLEEYKTEIKLVIEEY